MEIKMIGGHIHIATITPDAGFQWVVPPKMSGSGFSLIGKRGTVRA
jgi:hypothetical protein